MLWLERTSGGLLVNPLGKPSTVLVVGRMTDEGHPRGAQERKKLQGAGKGNPVGYKGNKIAPRGCLNAGAGAGAVTIFILKALTLI